MPTAALADPAASAVFANEITSVETPSAATIAARISGDDARRAAPSRRR